METPLYTPVSADAEVFVIKMCKGNRYVTKARLRSSMTLKTVCISIKRGSLASPI